MCNCFRVAGYGGYGEDAVEVRHGHGGHVAPALGENFVGSRVVSVVDRVLLLKRKSDNKYILPGNFIAPGLFVCV